jgi:hypothetical protein
LAPLLSNAADHGVAPVQPTHNVRRRRVKPPCIHTFVIHRRDKEGGGCSHAHPTLFTPSPFARQVSARPSHTYCAPPPLATSCMHSFQRSHLVCLTPSSPFRSSPRKCMRSWNTGSARLSHLTPPFPPSSPLC